MESLGDILRRVSVRDNRRAANGGSPGVRNIIAFEEVDEADPCPICHGAGWVSKRVPVGHPDFGEAFPCSRCQQRRDPAQRSDALSRYSNLGALRRINFGDTRENGLGADVASREMFREGMVAAVSFAENPSGWLVFSGPSGSGKTHLAVAAANRCIERGLPTYFIVAADLLDHLRATYAPDSALSYDELFEQVRNAPILVLDDLSSQLTSPWAHEKLHQIISHRFNESLPTIITVRGPLDRLEEGLRTRMESSTGFSQVYKLGEYVPRLAGRIGAITEEMRQANTFENFDVFGRPDTGLAGRESLARAWRAAKAFAEAPAGWLLITGERGCGKTHLAVAIAVECERRGKRVFRAFVPDLMDHLRGTFSPSSPIRYDELFEQVRYADLLVLDDLGTQVSTPWADEKLYQIVASRYDDRLPTVITSVESVDELAQEWPNIGSRLVDQSLVDWHPISAPNYVDQRRHGAGS